jgi:F-type H+-transporting ATPase subunit c
MKLNFRKTLLALEACIFLLAPHFVFAAEEAAHGGSDPYRSLGLSLALGLAVFGGALGQAKTAAAALEGIGRNPSAHPKIFTPMIIGLALIESLVLYAFVIAFMKI